MPRPPDDDFPDVIAQVEAALDGLDVADGATREALLDGVREALRSIGDSSAAPAVELVDGGRTDDAPRTGEKPDLRVAEAPAEEPAAMGRPTVRIVRATRRAGDDGTIVLDPEPGEAEWQPVFHGESPRTYRVLCTRGRLRITADGAAVGALRAGQSADLDARAIRVGADERSEGRYVRLP